MRAIILAGGPENRELNCSQEPPRPFWPVLMRPIVLQLIEQLTQSGVSALTVCANGRTALYADRLAREPLRLAELRFSQDPLPRGPAGCIKDNQEFLADEPFVVANAACWLCDRAATLLKRHRQQRNKLTVFCRQGTNSPGGVYVCDPEVLKHIPEVGYCDIKEQLIPRLLQHGQRVGAISLDGLTGEVVSLQTYFSLQHRVLYSLLDGHEETRLAKYDLLAPGVWLAADAFVSASARLIGPVIVGPGARVEDGAVVIGPTTVGPGAVIGENAIVTECVLWAEAVVPRESRLNLEIISASVPSPRIGWRSLLTAGRRATLCVGANNHD